MRWKTLVKRYADGRPICNCGDAYLAPVGEGYDADGNRRTDLLVCQYGCQANQIYAKEEIAERICEEFLGMPRPEIDLDE